MAQDIRLLGYPDAKVKLAKYGRYLIEDANGNCLDAGENEETAARTVEAVIKQKAERGDPTAVRWLRDRDEAYQSVDVPEEAV